jgi:hypothetical protein
MFLVERRGKQPTNLIIFIFYKFFQSILSLLFLKKRFLRLKSRKLLMSTGLECLFEMKKHCAFLPRVFSASSCFIVLLPKKEGWKIVVYFRFSSSQLPAMLIITAITIAMITPISVLIAPSTAAGPSSP